MRAPRLRSRRGVAILLAGAVLLTACGGETADVPAATGTNDEGMRSQEEATDETPGEASPADTTTSEEPVESEAPPAEPPIELTATRPDGSTFTLADFGGQTLFVETFATWCSNCRRQLGDTNAAAAQAPDDVAFLILSVETSLDPAELDAYKADNGFDNLTFGVLDAESLAALDGQFGRSVLNPPSTPKFIVTPDGQISELTTGYESVDEILAQL